jgi:hypothetical protein
MTRTIFDIAKERERFYFEGGAGVLEALPRRIYSKTIVHDKEFIMTNAVFALPVSVEQLALTIRQMPPPDRLRLIELVPELRQATVAPKSRTREEMKKNVDKLRARLHAALDGERLSPEEPFLGNLTLGQYLDLPDNERGRLWEEWSALELDDLEEQRL